MLSVSRRWFSTGRLFRQATPSSLYQEWVPKTGSYPSGFVCGALATGVKKKPAQALDLSLVVSTHSQPCTASAVFTKNAFAAAPVQLSRQLLQQQDPVSAVVVNSGCANACTGQEGLLDAQAMSDQVRRTIGTPAAVMSTGVIGQRLQMDKITSGIQSLLEKDDQGRYKRLSNSHAAWLQSAQGIMTTDTFPKLKSQEFSLQNKSYKMAGWSKGAGMIHPNMATMLSCIFTDVSISKDTLNKMVSFAADRSFNAISVDGDTSTNDTFMVLANGASGVCVPDDPCHPQYIQFQDQLTEFASELAKLIVRDGEGATKFIEIDVQGARTFQEAKHVASTIATSPLVKTAIYGKDANWGRIVCAVGYSGVAIEPDQVNLYFGSPMIESSLHLFKNGAPFDVDEKKASDILDCRDITVRVDLGLGSESAKVYTCDFSTEYVHINADYRS